MNTTNARISRSTHPIFSRVNILSDIVPIMRRGISSEVFVGEESAGG
jgi:hypothetical protein